MVDLDWSGVVGDNPLGLGGNGDFVRHYRAGFVVGVIAEDIARDCVVRGRIVKLSSGSNAEKSPLRKDSGMYVAVEELPVRNRNPS